MFADAARPMEGSLSQYTHTHTHTQTHTHTHTHTHTYVYMYKYTYTYTYVQRDGRNNKYVLIPEVNILGRKNTKRTQRRGRNVWAWVG